MSWQVASFGLLVVALAGGFAWYERSHSDARTVALVATLAALAALGRIAFVAIPNVKPTTDIVLISGYALGGAPGFVVGAIAGLTSNFFFGQGPWTPWQMAAWGAAGIIGAALAPLTGRRIGRWPLAIVCGVVGFAFAAVQDFGDWVTYSDHSSGQLGVYVAKGIGFDFVHAAGCVVFALAFGPALIRSIQRFARRLHVNWGPVAPARAELVDGAGAASRATWATRAPVVALALLSAGWLASQPGLGGVARGAEGGSRAGVSPRATVARAGVARPAAAGTPTTYLLSVQNSDGGFGASPGTASSPAYAGWAALGLAAAGHNPVSVRHGGTSLLGYIEADVPGDPGSLERTILVARAAGMSATSFGGRNLIARLEGLIRANGSVSNQVNLTSFAVLALRSAGVAPPASSLAWLVRQQDGDGGFSFATAGGSSDDDDTGAAIQALAGVGGGAVRARGRAVAFLRRQQARDGGFPQEPGGETNAQSTAWAVQGLLAAGVDPGSVHRAGGGSPLAYLTGLIAPDGHVRYSHGIDQTPVWVTGQALMALAGKALPIAPLAHAATATTTRHHRRATPHSTGASAVSSIAHHDTAPKATHHHRHRVAKAAGRRATPSIHDLAGYAAAAAALAFAPVGLR